MASKLDALKVGQRYARALFEVAQEQGDLDAVSADLQELWSTVSANEDVQTFFAHPAFTVNDKLQLVDEQFKGLHGSVHQLLRVMVENDRFFALESVVNAYGELLDAHRQITHASVTSAITLDSDLVDRLRHSLATQFGYTTVQLEQHVDPDILGGLIIRIEDRIIDGSYRGRLQTLTQTVGAARH